jgi:polysaccharide biosynthesis transport protein
MPEEEIDLRELINVLLKRKWLIIGIFLIAVLVAGVVSFFILEPVYKVTATIMLNEPKNISKLITYYFPEQYSDMFLDSEIEAKIIENLNLDESPHNLTAFSLEQGITTKVDKNIIEISYQFSDPEVAKNVTNQWIEMFIQKQNQLYLNDVNNTYNTIVREYEKVENEFLDIEKKKVQFDIDGDVAILSNKLDKNRTKINSHNSRLAEIALSIAKLETTKELINKRLEEENNTIKLKRSIDDEHYFQRLIDKITDGDFENQALWYEIEEMNPIYYDLVDKLFSIESSINEMHSERKHILLDLNKLNPEIDELSKNLMNVKIVENSLNRDYTKAVESYNNIFEKFKEIDLVYQSKSDILEIKKLAYKPEAPIKPNKKLNIAIGGVLGLFMGIFIAFFLEFWQSGKK